MSTLKQWMAQATTEQQLELAASIKSSRAQLYHLSSGIRTASADFGGAVERETRRMARQGLPIVTRGELVPACAACSYYKTCKPSATPELDAIRAGVRESLPKT